MQQEQTMILEMLKNGQINVEEAKTLFDTADKPMVKSENRKFIRIYVKEGDDTKVNINVPLALAKVGLKFVPQDKLKVNDHMIDLDEIQKMITDDMDGELVNINGMQDGKEVQVRIVID